MNYTTILIDNKKIGLKFGMASFRYIQQKIEQGKIFNGEDLNEISIAHILYSGYYNNCIVKDINLDLTFENIIDWIENNLKDPLFMETITEVIKIWSDSDLIKSNQEIVEDKKPTKKKITHLKK